PVTLKQLMNIEVPPKSAASDVTKKPGLLLQGEFKTGGLSLKEGQMIQTTGWLHLANYDSGDSDYHLQLTDSQSGCAGGCVIVEMPRDTCAAEPSEATRWHFLGSRNLVDVDFARVGAGQFARGRTASDTPKQGDIRAKPLFVKVEGQLFFDTHHYPSPTE